MRNAARQSGTKLWVLAGVTAALLLFVGANAHLLYVALEAQPECVDHIKMPDEARPGQLSAANSAC